MFIGGKVAAETLFASSAGAKLAKHSPDFTLSPSEEKLAAYEFGVTESKEHCVRGIMFLSISTQEEEEILNFLDRIGTDKPLIENCRAWLAANKERARQSFYHNPVAGIAMFVELSRMSAGGLVVEFISGFGRWAEHLADLGRGPLEDEIPKNRTLH